MLGKLNFYVTRVSVFLIPVALIVGMAGFDGVGSGHTLTISQNLEILTWFDLDAIRNNLAGNHKWGKRLAANWISFTNILCLWPGCGSAGAWLDGHIRR